MNKEYLRDFSKEEIYDLYDAVVTKNKKLYDNITKSYDFELVRYGNITMTDMYFLFGRSINFSGGSVYEKSFVKA